MNIGNFFNQRAVTRVDAAGVASAVLVTGILLVAVVRPAISRAEASEGERHQLASAILELRETEQLLADLRQRRRELDEARASVVALRPASELNARLADLPTIAQAHGVVVAEVSPGQMQTQAGRGRVPIRVAGIASFRSFAAMLADLHASHRDLEVTALSIDAVGNSADAAARFSLSLLWHTARGERDGRAERNTGASRDGRADRDGQSGEPR